MADNENSAPKSKSKRVASSRKLYQQRMLRRQQKKQKAAEQAVSQTTSDPPIDSVEPSQEIPTTTTTTPNGAASVAVTTPVQTETPKTPPPKEPANAWDKPKKPAPQQTQSSKTRLNGDVAQQRPPVNGHAPLQIPGMPRNGRPSNGRPLSRQQPPQQPNGRGDLFKGKTVAQPQRRIQEKRSKVSVMDRLRRNKHLVESMPDDYVAPVRSRTGPGVSPRREQQPQQVNTAPVRPQAPLSSRPPTGPRTRPESRPRQQRDRRMMKNGGGPRPMQNGSPPNGRAEPRQKTSRPQTSRQAKTNGSANRPSSSSSISSPSSRTTRSSSKQSLSKSSSVATSSSSSPIRRAKKDLRKVGMKKVTNGKQRIIKKQATVWLNGISDPALIPSDSKLNPEAPLFESTAILTESGAFLNDDYYRQPNGMMIPMTQPLPQMPVAPQPTTTTTTVTPSEPDFSQAANNYPSYQPVYPDMFGSGDGYYNYSAAAYSMYPAESFMSGGPSPHATHVPSQFGTFGNYTPNEFNESYPQFHSTNHPGSGYYPSSSGYASQQSTGAYSGASSRYLQNGMASGATSGTVSVSTSQDFSQMMAPTHVPNGVHTNGSVAVVNGNTGQGTTSTSAELTGVSSSAVSEQSGVNGNDSSMNETAFMYENSATSYYAANGTM